MEKRARALFRLTRYIFPLYYLAMGLFALVPYLLPELSITIPNEDRFDARDEMTEVTMNTYGANGSASHYTQSSKVSYLHEDDLLLFDQFRMRYYSDGGETMLLQSGSGILGNETIDLDGVVKLERTAGGGGTHERVTTRNVEIRTDKWVATTSEKATLQRGNLTVTGRGMIADLKRGTIDLLEDVKTSHEI